MCGGHAREVDWAFDEAGDTGWHAARGRACLKCDRGAGQMGLCRLGWDLFKGGAASGRDSWSSPLGRQDDEYATNRGAGG